jgi:hypothetical protein
MFGLLESVIRNLRVRVWARKPIKYTFNFAYIYEYHYLYVILAILAIHATNPRPMDWIAD